jgi:mono/diheme cytochrome c family protein
MPPWGKTLSASQIGDIVAYIRILGAEEKAEEKGVRFADVRKGGDADCAICHVRSGERKQLAPNLGYEGSKLNSGWLASFLKHPDRIRPIGFLPLTKTKMPNFYFSDDEVSALTSFLMTQKDDRVTGETMAGFNLTDEAEIERGRALFEDSFTCSACHRIGGESGGQVGPDLSTTALRLKPEWVFSWLKNPQAIRPDVPMPNFGITDAEARSLVAYLFSAGERGKKETPMGDAALIAKGEKMVKDKNCLACHILKPYHLPSGDQGAAATRAVATP